MILDKLATKAIFLKINPLSCKLLGIQIREIPEEHNIHSQYLLSGYFEGKDGNLHLFSYPLNRLSHLSGLEGIIDYLYSTSLRDSLSSTDVQILNNVVCNTYAKDAKIECFYDSNFKRFIYNNEVDDIPFWFLNRF